MDEIIDVCVVPESTEQSIICVLVEFLLIILVSDGLQGIFYKGKLLFCENHGAGKLGLGSSEWM